MKKVFALLALLALTVFSANAGTTVSNLLTYGSVNNTTNNGSPVLVGYAYVPVQPTFNIQNSGLFNTNDVLIRVQYGIDTNSFTSITNSYPASTNAADWQITPSVQAIPIYARVQVVTTNNTSVGTKAVFVSQ